MTPTRAIDINRRLVAAYMIRERIADGPIPGLSDVTMTEAVEASKIVAEMGPETDPERPGWKIHTCHIEPTLVHQLWFWALQKAHEQEIEDV